MTDDEILNLFFSDPDKVFLLYELGGGDYEELRKLKIAKLFAQEKFPELRDKEYDEAAESMFWFSYWIERELTEDISELEAILKSSTREEADAMLADMDLGEKIQYLVDNNHLKRDDPYYTFLRKIKTLRNHMAHGRLHELEYDGHQLSDPRGQLKLAGDLRNALLRRTRSA